MHERAIGILEFLLGYGLRPTRKFQKKISPKVS
jgi:hypothetical protein